MYAVVETGGKQYKVSVGQVVDVEKLAVEEGQIVELDRVLMVAQEGAIKVGTPLVEGAKIRAKVLSHDRGRKVLAFRYMPKERIRVRKGHRQEFTRLQIEGIIA